MHVGYVLAKQTTTKLSYVPLLLLFNFAFSMPYWHYFSFAIKRAFQKCFWCSNFLSFAVN